MKKSLVTILLIMLAFVQSFPQAMKSGLTGRNTAVTKYAMELLGSGQIKALSGNLQTFSLNGTRLNKYEGNPDFSSSVYRPSRVFIDTTQRDIYSYDFPGHLICRLSEVLYDGKWVTSIIDSMTYDSKGNVLTNVMKSYSNDVVISTSKVTYTYDSKGYLLVALLETQMNGYSIPGMRITYTYDASGNPATLLMESASFSGWTNMSRNTFTFDSKGNIIADLFEAWDNNAWRNATKDTYTYDGSSNMLASLNETWNGSAWENFSRVTNTYKNSNLITSLEEEWISSAWTNKSRLTCAYDNKGYFISDVKEQWGEGAWRNLIKHVYTNDTEGNTLKGESFEWGAENKWVPFANSMEFRYHGYSGKKEILEVSGSVVSVEYETIISGVENTPAVVQEYNLLQNYPNPFNPSTTINYSLKKEGNVKLTVFDALGKIVSVAVDEFKPAGSYSLKFDGSSLPSGMYIYRLEAGEFTTARKFILMK